MSAGAVTHVGLRAMTGPVRLSWDEPCPSGVIDHLAPVAVVALFSGGGGGSEGLRSLGLTSIGLDICESACSTLESNGHHAINVDVSELDPGEYVGVGGILATPPCQDFSRAKANAMGRHGATGHLVDVIPRWVEVVRPEWVVCEQVPSVLPIWRQHAIAYRDLGYSTWVGKLNAADFGVPQTRERAILMAKLGRKDWLAPEPTHNRLGSSGRMRWVSMAMALGVEPSGWTFRSDRQTNAARRSDAQPAPTITASMDHGDAIWIRGDQIRKLTELEAATFQSFPPTYSFEGTRQKRWEQIDNSFPPLMAKAIVRALCGRAPLYQKDR